VSTSTVSLENIVTIDSVTETGTYAVADTTVTLSGVYAKYALSWKEGQLTRFISRHEVYAALLDLTYTYKRRSP
jgi:hypothetical protein